MQKPAPPRAALNGLKGTAAAAAAQQSGAWSAARVFRVCLGGVLGAFVIWQLFLHHSTTELDGDKGNSRESALHGQAGRRSSSSRGSSRAAAGGPCDLDACVDVDLSAAQHSSSHLFGVALEDINHAIEGGLHVEMLRDWSFEARAYLAAHPELTVDSFKTLSVKPWPAQAPPMLRGRSSLQQASMDPTGIASAPLLDEQAWHVSGNGMQEALETVKRTALSELHALCIQSNSVTQTWLTNKGHTLQGFAVEANVVYRLRARAKGTWGTLVQASLGTSDGETMYAEAKLKIDDAMRDMTPTTDKAEDWVVLEATLRPDTSQRHVHLHLTWRGPGRLCLDWVSLVPKSALSNSGKLDPFHPRLVSALNKLQPQFLRFPGGAFVEGVTLDSTNRWKTTVGPRELRPGHPNANWGYWSSDGIGLFEFLQLSEQLAAQPVWVLPVGISHTESVAPDDLGTWIKDALDSLEFILGSATSLWGTVRASMGRNQPWSLRYVTLGNEDCRRPWYAQHFARASAAILQAYPQLQIISNCDLGTSDGGGANSWEMHVYKQPPELFKLRTLVDEYDGAVPVAVTEYAALGDNLLQNAVAEAGFMSAFENQCNKVQLMAYAPFMGHSELSTWKTTLISFNDSRHWFETPSYIMQQVFSKYWKGICVPVSMRGRMAEANIQASATCSKPGSSGRACSMLALKIINFSSQPSRVQLVLTNGKSKSLLHRRDSSSVAQEAVEADMLTLDELSLRPHLLRHSMLDAAATASGTTQSSAASAGSPEDEHDDDNILGLLSGTGLQEEAEELDPLRSIETTSTTPLQISISGKAVILDLPSYSVSVITAKVA